MIVGALPRDELRRRLRSRGLRVRIGPIVTEIGSPFRNVAAAIELHYASHALAQREQFVDFHVRVEPPAGLRRFLKPQAVFRFGEHLPFKPLPAVQAFPLLEWGMNWCVSGHCHQYLIVHAAVVERGGHAMILPAPPGYGKSTLCAALVRAGWRLFSDELALIDMVSGGLVPLPRPISLKNASIRAIRAFWPDAAMSEVVHDTLKGSVAHVRPPQSAVEGASRHAVPRWVVLPRFQAGSPTRLESLSKAAAFMQLADNAFNYSLHGRAGFDALADLIDASRCIRFTYAGNLNEAVGMLDRFTAS